jgi:glycosyltransferase involved in cell wall biosynthesis
VKRYPFKNIMSNNFEIVNQYKIAVVSAAPETIVSFMSSHLLALRDVYLVSAVCGGAKDISTQLKVPNVNYIDIPIARKVSPFGDLVSLFKLIYLFRAEKFILVQSITPKAGLLSMLAAWICQVPIRVHIFTGQVWVTRSGFSRWYLKSFDRLITALATSLLADSPSQKQFLVNEGIASAKDIEVLGDGSICGVDTTRFKPNHDSKIRVRAQLGVPEDGVLGLFLGRLKKDKGVLDLALAFSDSRYVLDNLYLLFVGPDEDNLKAKILELVASKRNYVRFVGSVNNPEDFLSAADFLCLPSYREGFGLVIIEAAATGIPTLASRIYGITDAIVHGATGILHEPGNSTEIEMGLQEMAKNRKGCQAMGEAAQKRALKLFSTSRVVNAQLGYYQSLIQRYESHAKASI